MLHLEYILYFRIVLAFCTFSYFQISRKIINIRILMIRLIIFIQYNHFHLVSLQFWQQIPTRSFAMLEIIS